jgi:hypothetical protein
MSHNASSTAQHTLSLQLARHLDLGLAATLAIGALHLLGASALLSGLVEDLALNLLGCALHLILDRGLSLSGSLLLGNAGGLDFGSDTLLGAAFLASCGLATRFSGDGLEDAWLGVAGGGTGRGHCEQVVVFDGVKSDISWMGLFW